MDKIVIGIDEVGRGCWAGPLVVGAVILEQNIAGLTDSKLLTKLKRYQYAERIRTEATYYKTGWVWPKEVDMLGLTEATTLAIERAIEGAPAGIPIIIDGSVNFLPNNPFVTTRIKADLTVPSVSAASVLAKVERDDYMAQQAEIYHDFGFERHVGYGTAQHKAALMKYGVTDIHRKSYKPIQIFL